MLDRVRPNRSSEVPLSTNLPDGGGATPRRVMAVITIDTCGSWIIVVNISLPYKDEDYQDRSLPGKKIFSLFVNIFKAN